MSFIPLALVLALCSKDRKRDEPARVTLNAENVSVSEILKNFERQTGISVEMDEAARERLNPSARVSIRVEEISPNAALFLLFKPYYLTVRWIAKKKVLLTVQY